MTEESDDLDSDAVTYLERRVTEHPNISAATVLVELRAGKHLDVSPEQHAANLQRWVDSLSPETRAMWHQAVTAIP